MRFSRFASLGLLVASAGLAGCGHFPRRGGSPMPCNSPVLPSVQRGNVESNIRTLPSKDQGTLAESQPARQYRALTAAQCLCLTAANSPIASLEQEEVKLVAAHSLPCPLKTNQPSSLRQKVLLYASEEVQNQTAGAALEAYYHLAEAEGKADLLAQGVAELDQAQRETESMVSRGLKPPVDLDVWKRQALTAKSNSIEAQMAIDKLNSQLRSLTGLQDCGENWRIWNPEGYNVSETPVDVDGAVATGLAARAEIQLLRLLVREAGVGSTNVVDDLLRSLNPLLGSSSKRTCEPLRKSIAMIRMICSRSDVMTRRQQLSHYLTEREAAVSEEIRQAAGALKDRTRLVALASAREHSWAEKVGEVKSRQKQGLASFAEIASANLDWYKARGDVVEEVMAWHIAWVKLRQAQGLLPADCRAAGYCR